MKIKRENLFLVACLVWFVAGVNIFHIGILEWNRIFSFSETVGAGVVFYLFSHFVFQPLIGKHTMRIDGYDFYEKFYKFFDKKSFVIMAFMMTVGMGLRKFHFVSPIFIAFFYTGLGCALIFAGLGFGREYLLRVFKIEREEKR